jgi:hypothetical protein
MEQREVSVGFHSDRPAPQAPAPFVSIHESGDPNPNTCDPGPTGSLLTFGHACNPYNTFVRRDS